MQNTIPSLPLVLTCGDPAGIAAEITLKAWAERKTQQLSPFYVVGDVMLFKEMAKKLHLPAPIAITLAEKSAVHLEMVGLPVCHAPLNIPVTFGESNPLHAPFVLSSITQAVEDVQRGVAAAIVTNPIQKNTLYAAGFPHGGHTEYLEALCGGGGYKAVMMLAASNLRVVLATVHVPLKDVAAKLSTEKLIETAEVTLKALQQDFSITAPRLAVAALNPHAGEGGTIGTEEQDIIAPAIHALRQKGWNVADYAPADTLFHDDARTHYDAVLCMYHDQALIPLKTLDFWGGVNITLGLPIVRTSPDHGTALGIAGQGIARADSLIAAVKQAAILAVRRGL